MRITQSSGDGLAGLLSDNVLDIIKKIFQVSIVPTLAMYIYLLYGLFSGQLADVAGHAAEQSHAMMLVTQLSLYLNISLVVTLLTGLLLYYDFDPFGYILVAIAAFQAYGLQFSIDMLFSSDAARLKSGPVSDATLHEMTITAMMIGAPGVLMILRSMGSRFFSRGKGDDLANISYGKDAVTEDVPRPLIGALAKCWQLPFCREGIRKNCPIFHAKTKCWKERCGCMCEENIILLAMTGTEAQKPVNMTKEMGFVPIGDLISKGNEEKRASVQTRVGPRGVRIPTNPHLTETQKRYRCNNCIIYNEHQRQKYQLLSPPVTLAVPVLVAWQFDGLRHLVNSVLHGLDTLIGHLTFSNSGGPDISKHITSSLPIETMLIICLTLVLMTWAQRLLEYCSFKLKI